MFMYESIVRARSARSTALLAAGGVLAGSAMIGLLPTAALASSHREAPLIAADPAVDNTDVYAFSSPENPDTVTLIGNWTPFEEPNGGPNFYPWATGAAYDINIDNDGDAVADIVYRWEFSTQDDRGDGSDPRNDTFLYNNGKVTTLDDANLLFKQTYDLSVSIEGAAFAPVVSGVKVAPSFTGPAGMPDYNALREEAITDLPGGGQTLAAQADDSFFLDLRVFDLLYGGDLSETGQDTLAGYNVNTIALQVPKTELAIAGDATNNPVIGVWSTTSRAGARNADGSPVDPNADYVQVSRLGQPLVNEVVIPAALKDTFNAIDPSVDATVPAVVDRVINPELPYLIEEIYGVTAPGTDGDKTTRDDANRFDIAEIFLSGITTNAEVDIDGNPDTDNPINVALNSQAQNTGSTVPFQLSEMLRLNMSTPVTASPSRLGVLAGDFQGFPNGRRLGDDVVDIEILALEGISDINNIPADRQGAFDALKGGDGVNQNGPGFSNSFPYVALPNQGAVNGGAQVGDGNPQPVPPATGGTSGTDGGSTAPVASGGNASGYPTGGVETGEGGLDHTLIPALTGSAALLLLGAGAGSLLRSRTLRRKVSVTSEV
ncbi:protein of unknown function [Modestobacter sp. DSM 44400]|uniref:DUF4331 domain-containing protein n=1 Tax=Modestobacter sp. DSM 44400 TaxID=1550230 RepID=UPI00089A201F|nr:DUF4331 domain-containing protein [Modestobacter sp. DSM 44400]SDY76056.1 protein of unknown function [Modestobacter sp. DSM 44400]